MSSCPQESYTEVPVNAAGDSELVEHCHWKAKAEPPSAIPQLLAALVLCGLFMVNFLFNTGG